MAGEGVWLRRSAGVVTVSPAVVGCYTLLRRLGLRIAPAGRARRWSQTVSPEGYAMS